MFFFRLICFHTYAFFCLGSFCGIFLGLLRFCIPCSCGVHVKQYASLVPCKIRPLTTHHCPLRKFIFPVVPTMYCNDSIARAVTKGGCRGCDTPPLEKWVVGKSSLRHSIIGKCLSKGEKPQFSYCILLSIAAKEPTHHCRLRADTWVTNVSAVKLTH